MKTEMEERVRSSLRMADADERASALKEICVDLAETGSFAEACSVAGKIEDGESRAWALVAIACGQFNAGDMRGGVASLDGAKSAAASMPEGIRKAATLGMIHATEAPLHETPPQ
ncbi:MAG: hypothetical protein FJ280_18415 [Planctomycetes bacterium]|nr:hypothetical protein [Planctomycetota bacterium]